MKNVFKCLGLIALAAIIGFSMVALSLTGCDNGTTGGGGIRPEDMPVKDRWWSFVDSTSTATLDYYFVDDDGLCVFTVGGTAQANDETDNWGIWKVIVGFKYTGNKGKSYAYTFEARTESGSRDLNVQYYEDNVKGVYLSETVPITTSPATFTVYGQVLPGKEDSLRFKCADQLGTVYIKILEIKEYTPGKLTITNFSGILNKDDYIEIRSDISEISLVFLDEEGTQKVQIKGNTITFLVQVYDQYTSRDIPFLGNITIEAGDLEIFQYKDGEWADRESYSNKVPITFTNGNATINFRTQMEEENMDSDSGSLTYQDFYYENYDGISITGYKGAGGSVTIPAQINGMPVTRIGQQVFQSHSSLTGVTIPDSVTSIGCWAFRDCTRLTSITIGNSVTDILEGAFRNCTSLTSITIPDSVTKIYGDYYYGGVFEGCTSLASVTIGNSVISIGESAFADCTRLASVTIPDSVTDIGEGAFRNCASLNAITVDAGNSAYSSQDGVLYNNNKTTLIQYPAGKQGSIFTIPNSVTSIWIYAFYSCTSLTGVTIPISVTSIEDRAFLDCTSLTAITVVTGNSAYISQDGVLYDKNRTLLHTYPTGKAGTTFTIPNSVTSIGICAFSGSKLTGVTIPNSVISIGEWAFEGCTSLASVTIPDSVTSIGWCAFYRCTSLISVIFQGTIVADNFDSYAFYELGDLRDKYFARGKGTYTTTAPVGKNSVWTKQ